MKFFLLFAGFLFSVFFGFSQAVVISATNPTTTPNPNVILSIQSGTQGIQLPLMDSTARLSISLTPAGGAGPNSNAGILVFDTTTSSVWYTTSGSWINLANTASGGGWSLTGNAGTVDSINFVGTTDNTALNFRVNNQPSGRIDPTKQATFFGYQAGMNNTGFANSANGYQALFSNTVGLNNLANGWKALYSNTSGSSNSANGVGALYMNTTGSYNLADGYDALNANTTGNDNTGVGYFSLGYNSSGNNNTASGWFSLGYNSTGNNNTGAGYFSLANNTNGNNNTATGYYALGINISGNNNTASGSYSLFNNFSGSNNVAIGAYSLYANTTTSDLVAIGDSALLNNAEIHNTAVGYQALYTNTTGANNTAVGYGSLHNNNSGNGLTAFGSLTNAGVAGSFNTVLGYQATAADGITDAAAVGSNANVTTSYTIQLGDLGVTAVNSYGTFNTISDGRFKFNICEDVSGLDFVMRLRPVTYQLDTRKIAIELAGGKTLASFAAANNETRAMNIRRTGFIAQEVEKAADESGFDFDGVKKPQNDKDHYSLSYQEFVVPLVKAVQEQQKEISDLRREIEDLKKLVAKISKD
jgi:hypothetical protein